MLNSDSPTNFPEAQPRAVEGRLLALDLGMRRVGVAVCDELRLTIKTLLPLKRTNWKHLLRQINELQRSFDAQAIVIGLPLKLDGTEGNASQVARRIARNLSLSLTVPVYLQDERLTSRAAEELLREGGLKGENLATKIDGQAAAIMLRDFISQMDNELQ